jgi:hypothetical protein
MENIINFCKKNKIKYLPIKLEIEGDKKTYLDWTKHKEKSKWSDGRNNFIITDFEKYSLEVCEAFFEAYKNETKYIGIDATDIQNLDIDDITGKYKGSELEKEFIKLPYFLSLNKKATSLFYEDKIQ